MTLDGRACGGRIRELPSARAYRSNRLFKRYVKVASTDVV
jgi:hypothetical protein